MLTIEFILKEIKNINFSFTGELQLKDNGHWTTVGQQSLVPVIVFLVFPYFVCVKIRSLRSGDKGMAAEAVAPRTERNHTADASPTLIPLLFKTLRQNTLKKYLKNNNAHLLKEAIHSPVSNSFDTPNSCITTITVASFDVHLYNCNNLIIINR